MSQKRVVRVISYEGIDTWVDETIDRSALKRRPLLTFFDRRGTVRELECIELREGERLRIVVERE